MSNETQQETWNATHAQLLKSVADAQAKLLAAQNETNDRLADLPLLTAKLDAIGAMVAKLADLLAPPRRQVETVADIIQAQLDTLPPAVAKAKRQELHRLAVKVFKRPQRKQRR